MGPPVPSCRVNREGGEQSQTGKSINLGDELGQVVQLLLQRCRIGISHHDVTVETLLADSDSYVLAVTFEDLGARDHETVGVRVGGVRCVNIDTLALGLFSEGSALAVADLFDSVGTLQLRRVRRT